MAAVPQLPDFEASDGGSTEHGFEPRLAGGSRADPNSLIIR
jgi:hypothetical protein